MLCSSRLVISSDTFTPSIVPVKRAGGLRRYPESASWVPTAIAATVADPTVFKSGREFAAWIGLVPRQNSSGMGGREVVPETRAPPSRRRNLAQELTFS
jgi:transposase